MVVRESKDAIEDAPVSTRGTRVPCWEVSA
jgi:hypothetical protein